MKSKIVTTHQTGIHPRLQDYVLRHSNSSYQKPIQSHNRKAFQQLEASIEKSEFKKWILDSGCGTGMSTYKLAESHPDHGVIGIDQSEQRLNKGLKTAPLPRNAFFFRANCEDIWRLCVQSGIVFEHHFILYPNPWPKSQHLQRRWHGHPVFTCLPKLSTDLLLRSNWKLYLEEFEFAWRSLLRSEETLSVKPETVANVSHIEQVNLTDEYLTLFEMKYHQSGQEIYQLRIHNSNSSKHPSRYSNKN